MGQYWTYVNIDEKESNYEGGGCSKLGEFFFDSQEEIIKLLAIPILPADEFGGSWAGSRLICLGDYAHNFPRGTMTPHEMAELKDARTRLEAEHGDYFSSPSALMENLRAPAGGYTPFFALTDGLSLNYVWVLRNLNKKEYVRSNGIPEFDRDDETMTFGNHSGLWGTPGLGGVLLSRIGWSGDSSCSMRYEDVAGEGDQQLHRGPWAGDRIDVRGFDECEEDMRYDGWVDITKMAARQIHKIYKSEYGDTIGDYESEPEDDIDM